MNKVNFFTRPFPNFRLTELVRSNLSSPISSMPTRAIRFYFWPAVGAAREARGAHRPADQQLAIEPKVWIGSYPYCIHTK